MFSFAISGRVIERGFVMVATCASWYFLPAGFLVGGPLDPVGYFARFLPTILLLLQART